MRVTQASSMCLSSSLLSRRSQTPALPKTKFRKKPKKRGETREVKFSFISDVPGSTFVCKREKKSKSDYTKKVKVGKHILRVVAVDRAGNVDKSPALCRFKIVK